MLGPMLFLTLILGFVVCADAQVTDVQVAGGDAQAALTDPMCTNGALLKQQFKPYTDKDNTGTDACLMPQDLRKLDSADYRVSDPSMKPPPCNTMRLVPDSKHSLRPGAQLHSICAVVHRCCARYAVTGICPRSSMVAAAHMQH